jgi:hypothetical protein
VALFDGQAFIGPMTFIERGGQASHAPHQLSVDFDSMPLTTSRSRCTIG